MTSIKLLIAAAFLFAATSASMAQGYVYYAAPYASYQYGPGLYDYAPGVAYGPGYGYYRERGGPGPRVGNGTGMGIGAQR